MKWNQQIFRVVAIFILLIPANIAAAASSDSGGVVINELQTGSLISASDEFIELYNTSTLAMSVTDWRVEYMSATGTTWTSKVVLNGLIYPHRHYLLASNGYLSGVANAHFNAGMAKAGGHVRLVGLGQPATVQDLVGWGTASSPEGRAAPAPDSGQSLNRRLQADNEGMDTNDNASDFIVSQTPSPLADNVPPVEPAPAETTPVVPMPSPEIPGIPVPINPTPDPQPVPVIPPPISPEAPVTTPTVTPTSSPEPASSPSPVPDAPSNTVGNASTPSPPPPSPPVAPGATEPTPQPEATNPPPDDNPPPLPSSTPADTSTSIPSPAVPEPPTAQTYAPIMVNELLIDPVAPALDTSDEFIELYNPTDTAVNLDGYTLESASTTVHSYHLPALSISAKGYIVLYSRDIPLSLTNGGGRVSLLSPQNVLLSQSDAYPQAIPGEAWALLPNAAWGWTDKLTPGAANLAPDVPAPVTTVTTETTSPPVTEPPADEGSTPVPAISPENPATEPVPDTPTSAEPPPLPDSAAIYNTQVEMSELLVNPAAPASDDTDEYIELHNPTDQPVSLMNYRLEAGNTFNYHYTIPELVIQPHGYLVFYSSTVPITLSNSAGKVRLLTPTGELVDEAAPYGTASEGAAWAYNGTTWQWTKQPTPGAANAFVALPTPVPKTTAAPKAAAAKSTKSTATKAASKATPKTTTKAAAKKTTAKATPATTAQLDEKKSPSVLHPLILAGVGGLALLYAAYEYRQDLANRFYQLRRYREARRAARAKA